jgi:hypothetical protein
MSYMLLYGVALMLAPAPTIALSVGAGMTALRVLTTVIRTGVSFLGSLTGSDTANAVAAVGGPLSSACTPACTGGHNDTDTGLELICTPRLRAGLQTQEELKEVDWDTESLCCPKVPAL